MNCRSNASFITINSPPLMSQTVVLASSNPGKLRELQILLAPHRLEVVAQSLFTVPDAEETGLSFVENAILKARHACRHTGLPALADDSGLEVDALDGAPGIRSARFSGAAATDARNIEKLLALLEGVPEARRTARFQCLLVFLRHAEDPTPLICQGTWEGRILTSPRGDNGFGYDPIFFIPDTDCSAAQLTQEQKNTRSHRSQALAGLLAALTAGNTLPVR